MNITRRIAAAIAMLALVLGLTTFINATTAIAADTGSEATFSSSFNGSATADAKANAVAIAGADARGKILLEEFRAQIPQSIQDKWKPPTRAQIDRYGTLVSSLTEANAVIATQTKAYDKIVNKARANIKKLKLRIKHKDGNVPKLKKQLKRAKKALTAIYVDKNWKYRPLVGLTVGICFTNRGLLGERTITDVQVYRDCVGDAEHRDEKVVWIGLNPVMREMRIVAVELTNGTIVPGCLNVPDLVVPPGLPDESLFLIVRSIAEVIVDVYVAVGVNGQLVVIGELKQNGVTCDREEQTVPVSQVGLVKHVQVRGMAVDKAIAFAENQVQASASATATATANVQTSVEFSVSKTMTLYCPPVNNPPTCELVQFPLHVYVSQPGQVPNRYRFKVVWNDANQQLTKTSGTVTVTGQAFIVQGNQDFPEIWDTEGTQVVYTGFLEAKQQTGNATLSTTVTDSQGAQCTMSKTFPIVPDEF